MTHLMMKSVLISAAFFLAVTAQAADRSPTNKMIVDHGVVISVSEYGLAKFTPATGDFTIVDKDGVTYDYYTPVTMDKANLKWLSSQLLFPQSANNGTFKRDCSAFAAAASAAANSAQLICSTSPGTLSCNSAMGAASDAFNAWASCRTAQEIE